jgi:peroxiredoxin
MITVGRKAPDFTLKDQNNKSVRLSSLRGKKVLLSFRPLAWTAVCQDQMKSLEQNHVTLDELNVVALGIGVDSVPSNKAWAEAMNIKNTRLLSDFWPHGAVAKRYGVLRSNGVSERALFIIDKKGIVRYIDVHDINKRPPLDDLVSALEKLK